MVIHISLSIIMIHWRNSMYGRTNEKNQIRQKDKKFLKSEKMGEYFSIMIYDHLKD